MISILIASAIVSIARELWISVSSNLPCFQSLDYLISAS